MDIEDIVKIVVVLGVCAFMIIFFRGCCADMDRQEAVQTAWAQQHDTTLAELKVFARIMNVGVDDVIASKGLQAEFQRFENGDLRQTGQEVIHHGKTSETRNTFN